MIAQGQVCAQGQVWKAKEAPFHRWVVLNDPAASGKVFFVNLTTLTDRCVDDACVIDGTDYGELDRKTTVAYSRRMCGSATALALHLVNFDRCADLSAATLQKLIDGAKRSDYVSQADLALL
jgi:hypothetical protein